MAKRWIEFRAEFLMSQVDLANLLGISRRSVQYTERAKFMPRKETLSLFETLYKQKHAAKLSATKKRQQAVSE
jgi:ribosome-binding protein aMBF1 (putative translation factor)